MDFLGVMYYEITSSNNEGFYYFTDSSKMIDFSNNSLEKSYFLGG